MCGGWPCNCCAPVTKFDTHFDTERPWKCFFHDRQSLVDSSRPTGLSNFDGWSEEGFTKDYAYQHSRPMLGPCVASKFTLLTGVLPGATAPIVHTMMARMQWKDYDPDVWVDQLVTMDLDYEFALPIGSSRHRLHIFLGDEHDDPDQTYATTAKAWPNLWFTFERDENSTLNAIRGNFFFSNPESSISIGHGMFKHPPAVPPQFADTLQSASIHLEIEVKAAETRVRGTYAGQTIGWGGTGGPRPLGVTNEIVKSTRYTRYSPRFRVGINANSRAAAPGGSPGQFQPMKVDRWAVKTEPLVP
jgi:hypothetical protein